MKTIQLLAGLAISAAASLVFALDIQPYSPETLAAKQKAGEAVALHFHADWCPTCRAQEKVFNGWKGDAAVPGTLLIVNYDKERELKRQLGVRTQSTVIVYKGSKETGRLAGETDAKTLRAVLDSAK
ncbi:thioredoxin family protein [Ferribacterium limneticum]|uniref:thioredoxin family protein n=1 Tax=Ferribacterium limneticum TaxID=76259 RepID=UPI001CFB8A63|nr:thioredoxin family protein [Ferribacterium limneticum]UCV29502.1 thioredoxin family protein [Ferribacterium limneticum]UCV33421.1 thioredoxin family protein [Ferribacterium limneticum]